MRVRGSGPGVAWLAALLAVGPVRGTNVSNVLMIVVDDFRPMVPAMEPERYGFMHTPNLDALVGESLVLRQSHVQQAVCGPSRTSALTGRRPDTTHVYDLNTYFRNVGCANCSTIPEMFKDEGYKTWGLGKVFHPECAGNDTDWLSWSEFSFTGDDWWASDGASPANGLSWYALSEEEEAATPTQDGEILAMALDVLTNVTDPTFEDPWFVAVGFHKPHLSLVVPERFFDLYPNDTITLADNPYAPGGIPPVAYASWELQNFDDVANTGFAGQINETLVDWKAYEVRRAYQAAVSYTDDNVGQLLTLLKDRGAYDNTVVLLWGDHGFKLGEHGAWCKHTNFDIDTTSPVMLRVPGVTDVAGGVLTQALAEHVDLMPTLAEAAGLPTVALCPETDPWLTPLCTEGSSFLPLLDVAGTGLAAWKNASYSQYPRDASGDSPIMGYSMTTATNVRFTAWVDFNYATNSTDWGMTAARCGFELYNHTTDPDENQNLAYHDGMDTVVDAHFEMLKAGWRSSLQSFG